LQEIIDTARGQLIDTAELALYQAVKRGEAWAVCFSLKTVGHHRGYIERHKVEHEGGTEIRIAESIRTKRIENESNGNGNGLARTNGVAPGPSRLPGPQK